MHISELGLSQPGAAAEQPSSQKIPTPKVAEAAKASEADSKLRSPQYRDKVRLVLEYLGEPMTMGKYRELDGAIDWSAMAESIENPILSAICQMTDESGRIVAIEGVPVTFLEEIPAKHKDNPQKWCSWRGRSKVFIKWWMEN